MTADMLEASAPVDGHQERFLDDWHRTINRIYVFQNLERDSAFLFMHLVEVCGGLRAHREGAPRAEGGELVGFDLVDVVPKALAWWFALCAKVGVRSVEEIIWAKFPATCPYCHSRPHQVGLCTPRSEGPDWEQLALTADANLALRPRTLNGFAGMLSDIYEPAGSLQYAVARLGEELGELGEALRVFDIAPHFFLNEAPDVFAWLMQCHRLIVHRDFDTDLEERLSGSYPDRCTVCTLPVCVCQPVLDKDIGRLAGKGPKLEVPYRPRGAFLTPNEIFSLVQSDPPSVAIGGKTLTIDDTELTLALADLSSMMTWLVGSGTRSEEQLASLVATVRGLEMSALIEETRIVELAQEVGEVIERLSKESRSELSQFARGFLSDFFAALVLNRLQASPGS